MKVGAKDDFENRYMGRFRQLMAPHGVFVEYERPSSMIVDANAYCSQLVG